MNQSSSGTLVLTGANTYTGLTTVSSGTLQLGNGTANGSVAGNISTSTGTSVVCMPYSSLTYGGVISGSGSVTKSGSGTLTLTGTNTYTGLTTVSTGTLQLGNGTTSGSVAGNISVGSTLTWMPAGTLTYGGVISGSGAVNQSSSGTLVLTGANTYTGLTTVSTGTLQLGNGTTSGSVAGNISVGSTLTWMPAGTLTYGGVISGSASREPVELRHAGPHGCQHLYRPDQREHRHAAVGQRHDQRLGGGQHLGRFHVDLDARHYGRLWRGDQRLGRVTKSGSGTLTLTGTNTYTGLTTVSTGTLQLGNGTTSGSVAGNISVGSTLTWMPAGTLTYGGVISVHGSVNLSGSSTLVSRPIGIRAATTINSGTLQLGAAAACPAEPRSAWPTIPRPRSISTATRRPWARSPQGSSGGNITTGSASGAVLTVTGSTSTTYAGVISGAGGLIMSSTATLTLSGANTYSGPTTINSGTLLLAQGVSCPRVRSSRWPIARRPA